MAIPARDAIVLSLDELSMLVEMIEDSHAWEDLDEDELGQYRDIVEMVRVQSRIRSPYGSYTHGR